MGGRANTGGAGAAAAGVATEVIQTDSRGVDLVEAGVVLAELRAPATASPTYRLLIDLSNAAGAHKHVLAGPARLLYLTSWLEKQRSTAAWEAALGTILAIDDTEATVGYIEAGWVSAHRTDRFAERRHDPPYPSIIPLDVLSGDYRFIGTSQKVTTTDLNTGVTIGDIGGNPQTPAVGDVIVRALRTSGGGDAEFYFGAHYYTVEP